MATPAAAPAPHLVLPHRDAHAPPLVVQPWSTRRVSGRSPNRSGDGRGTARGRCVARRVGGMLGEAEAGDGAGMEATSCHYCGTAVAATCIECRAPGSTPPRLRPALCRMPRRWGRLPPRLFRLPLLQLRLREAHVHGRCAVLPKMVLGGTSRRTRNPRC
ncbi:unnamed protein product [Miscanthus lutarioriparius]|uniref:Uncharacterized protein n=1 Tax=Miscanthus lutarioriparius TaxID=422564 RepID=A0A811PKP4_9POAL|nr:unnamed protein product [Miscanthus lutarioriparius]